MKLYRKISIINLLILSKVEGIKVVSNNELYQEDGDFKSSTEKPSDENNMTPGVGYIHNVSISPDSTICFKIKTYQFYQFYQEDYNSPQQVIFSMREKFTLATYPTISCEEFYPGCTTYIQAYSGKNNWKHGRTLFEIQGSPNRYPTWTPNTWTSICIIMKTDKKIIFINDALIEESAHVFTDTINTSFRLE